MIDTASLERRLIEAKATIKALLSGEIDAVVDVNSNTPMLLSIAQAALFKSEERYRQMIETTSAVNIAGSSLHDGEGHFIGSLGVVRDVTERKKMKALLIVSDRMASVGTLATGVAHEINNPLAAVIAKLALSRKG